MMTMTEQRQKYLKAKVALALYSEFGQVSKEDEIDHGYHLTRVLYKAVFGTHYTNSGNAIVEYGHESPNQADAASDGGGAGGAQSAVWNVAPSPCLRQRIAFAHWAIQESIAARRAIEDGEPPRSARGNAPACSV